MELNGKDDSFARWLQGGCAVVFFGVLMFVIWWIKHLDSEDFYEFDVLVGVAIVLVVLISKCGWYAMTGEGNINRDVLNSDLRDIFPGDDD